MEKEKCYRCNKILLVFYELEDTKFGRRHKFCKECGEEFAEWVLTERRKWNK
jgi:rRNA maturation endonuclease Nob1